MARQILYHWAPWEALAQSLLVKQFSVILFCEYILIKMKSSISRDIEVFSCKWKDLEQNNLKFSPIYFTWNMYHLLFLIEGKLPLTSDNVFWYSNNKEQSLIYCLKEEND